jgi:hypothetical protein
VLPAVELLAVLHACLKLRTRLFDGHSLLRRWGGCLLCCLACCTLCQVLLVALALYSSNRRRMSAPQAMLLPVRAVQVT